MDVVRRINVVGIGPALPSRTYSRQRLWLRTRGIHILGWAAAVVVVMGSPAVVVGRSSAGLDYPSARRG